MKEMMAQVLRHLFLNNHNIRKEIIMKNNRNKFLIVIGLLLVFTIIIGTSYAFWKTTKNQESSNVITSDCLDLDIIDVSPTINLDKAIPITDEEASNLTPYEFKIVNKCNTEINYIANLEVMGIENQLSSQYVAVSFNGGTKEMLSEMDSTDPTYKGDDYTATESYFLTSGKLLAKEEVTYNLKLWMNQDVTVDDDVMNKRFVSKISVTGGQQEIDTSKNLVQYLKKLQTEELVEDEFGNLRYVGNNPYNYIEFNNELWRIIGVMKDIENPDGTKEDKVKLIRSESIGNYAWDNKASGIGSSTSRNGSNDWSDSTLQKVLNEGAYYNRTSGDCPYGVNGATTPCDFSETGLINESKNMISESVWNLGGTANFTSSSNGLTKHWYSYERGSTVYAGRPTKWTGNVGLIYPSDYGYATSGGITTDRETCLNTILKSWKESEVSDCKNNDWLYVGYGSSFGNPQWALTLYSGLNSSVFHVPQTGEVNSSHTSNTITVLPVVYLESGVKVEIRSDGSTANPFVLK